MLPARLRAVVYFFRVDLAGQCCGIIFIWAFKIKIIPQRKMNFIPPDALVSGVEWRDVVPGCRVEAGEVLMEVTQYSRKSETMCVYVIGVGVGSVYEMGLARSGRVVGSGLRGLPWPGPASHGPARPHT